MSIPISNVVVTTDTFESWISITNQLCDAVSTRAVTVQSNTTGGVTTGNAHVNGYFSANTLIAKDELRGGTVDAAANLTVTTNTTFVGANVHLAANLYINNANVLANTANLTIRGGALNITSNIAVTTANVVNLSPNVVSIGANTLNVVANSYINASNVTVNTTTTSLTGGDVQISSNLETTGLSTFVGNTTFTGTLQTIAGNVNFDTGTVFVDATNNRLGVNTVTPDTQLQVVGNANVSSNVYVGGITTLAANTVLSGALQTISGNANFDSGVLFVDSVNNRVGFNNTAPDAVLAVTGTANVSGATRIANTLAVVGATTLSNTINVTGAATLSNTVTVVGTSNLQANVTMGGALQTIAGNVNFDTGTLFVDSVNNRVGLGNTAPDATLTITGTANVSGPVRLANTSAHIGAATFSNTVTVTGNTVVGTNAVYVSTEAGNTRVGILSNVESFAGAFYSLSVGGNTVVKDGNLVLSNGYLQTNQLKINNSGGLQLGENVALTFAGLIVGDVLPAYASGTLSVNVTTGNNVVVLSTGNTESLAVNYSVVKTGTFADGTLVQSIINSTAFSVSLAPTATATATSINYYSRYVSGSLASYALGSLTDTNKRWEAYTKVIVNNGDLTTGGKLDVTNTSTTHTVGGNVSFDAGTLFIDSANNKIGINNTAPTATLTLTGTASVSGNTTIGHNLVVSSGNVTITGNVHTITGNVNIDAGVLFVDAINNRVGINNTAPTVSLQVTGTSNVTSTARFGNTVTIVGNTTIGGSNVAINTDGTAVLAKSIKVANAGIYTNTTSYPTASAVVNIDSFDVSEFRTARYTINYSSNTNSTAYGTTEVLLMANTSAVHLTEYAAIFAANINFSVDASVTTGVCTLTASSAQGNLTINVTRLSMY